MTDQPAVGMFAALRVRNYRLFFAGQVVSNTGTWMQRIAQDWLVLQLTDSPFAVGLTTALQFGPMLFLGLFGGLIADRYPKRVLLLITQSAMGLLALVLAVLTLTGSVQVWQVYLIALGLGVATVVDNPARQTFVNEMVPPALVRNAVSLNSGNFQLARMVGPAVAGVLISLVGSGWAFALNAVSYLAVLAGLTLMRTAELQPQPRVSRGPGQLREGLRYVRGRPDILFTIVLVFFLGTFGYNFAIILSAYTKNVFHSGADLYGLLNTAMAAGSVVGALAAARRSTGRLALLFAAAAGFSGLLIALGLTPWLPLFVILLVATGFVSVTFNTLGNSTVQLSTDPELRGRVMSLYMLVFLGSTPLGSVLVGALTERWGAPAALVVTGTVCLLATAGVAVMAARLTGVSLQVDLHRGADHHPHLVGREPVETVPAGPLDSDAVVVSPTTDPPAAVAATVGSATSMTPRGRVRRFDPGHLGPARRTPKEQFSPPISQAQHRGGQTPLESGTTGRDQRSQHHQPGPDCAVRSGFPPKGQTAAR